MFEPVGEVVVVFACCQEFGPSASTARFGQFLSRSDMADLRWTADMSNVGVMSSLSSKKRGSSWTAERDSSEMIDNVDTFRNDVSLYIWHIIQRPKASVLIIANDEDYVSRLAESKQRQP